METELRGVKGLFKRSVLLAAFTLAFGSVYGQTTLIDTTTNATNYALAATPHTYVGDAFTNNGLPANTTQFRVTSGNVFLASAAAVAYVDIQARIQLWNTVTPTSTTAVFSNPAGGLLVIDFGAATLAAGSVYTLPFTLSLPAVLTGGSGQNWGITINFQGSTTAGSPVVDDTNISPALVYNTGTTGYAAGTITTGVTPTFGYYRNVESQTNFNFIAGDQRVLSTAGANNQGVAFNLAGNAVVVPEPSTVVMTGLGGLALLAGMQRLRRRQA